MRREIAAPLRKKTDMRGSNHPPTRSALPPRQETIGHQQQPLPAAAALLRRRGTSPPSFFSSAPEIGPNKAAAGAGGGDDFVHDSPIESGRDGDEAGRENSIGCAFAIRPPTPARSTA